MRMVDEDDDGDEGIVLGEEAEGNNVNQLDPEEPGHNNEELDQNSYHSEIGNDSEISGGSHGNSGGGASGTADEGSTRVASRASNDGNPSGASEEDDEPRGRTRGTNSPVAAGSPRSI